MRAASILVLIGCGGAAPAPRTPVANTPKPAAPPATTSIEDELVHGQPDQQHFDDLVATFPTMSEQRRATIAAIGTTETTAIRVPSIPYEYVWVAKIACNGGEGQVSIQALIETAHGALDKLEFSCPNDKATHAAYFDFSADPQEQAMKKELGGT
jgi:hypothetical protein